MKTDKGQFRREMTPRRCGICHNPIERLIHVFEDEPGRFVEKVRYRCSACKVQYYFTDADWR